MKELQTEMELDTEINDVDEYNSAMDPVTGYPIYMLFEVIHVYRKTLAEEDKEAKELRA